MRPTPEMTLETTPGTTPARTSSKSARLNINDDDKTLTQLPSPLLKKSGTFLLGPNPLPS